MREGNGAHYAPHLSFQPSPTPRAFLSIAIPIRALSLSFTAISVRAQQRCLKGFEFLSLAFHFFL